MTSKEQDDLFEAINNNSPERVKDIITQSTFTNLNFKDTDLRTPIYIATNYGYADIVDILLKAGANVNEKTTGFDSTLLLIACRDGRADIVDILLKAGADVNYSNRNGETPLHMAVTNDSNKSEENLELIVRRLLNYGADTTIVNKYNETPIDIANENNNVRLVEILEKRGDVVGGKRRRKTIIKKRKTIRKGKINKKRKTIKSKKSNKSKRRRL